MSWWIRADNNNRNRTIARFHLETDLETLKNVRPDFFYSKS